MPGWEEGLFPHQKSIEEKGESGLEEERRLAYVGISIKVILFFSSDKYKILFIIFKLDLNGTKKFLAQLSFFSLKLIEYT